MLSTTKVKTFVVKQPKFSYM